MKRQDKEELKLRRKLGIPTNAKKVLIFGETSHWDPNWIWTSEEYYKMRIKPILDTAIEQLNKEPLRVYSIECVFFLKMYWEKCPEKRDEIREHINSGRMRLSGSAMTTPDTNLPETELIIRDYLRGQGWLLENGMTQVPKIAYLPDGFGNSPALPSILKSLGVEYTAITRIDGMAFPATDFRPAWYYPRPSSNAWLLQKELKTVDFVWKSLDGAEILTHWNPFTYFQGDNIVFVGPVKWMGLLFGAPVKSKKHISKRINTFVKQLEPLSRTPYLFCPIGLDFNPPIEGLHELLDRHNSHYFDKTGTYVMLAGLDDYMDLVACHKDKLPTLKLDFNPYWMGYYASRPELKKRCKKLSRELLKIEKLSSIYSNDNPEKLKINTAWDHAIISNHHDFITGTSTDRVFKGEQTKWISGARDDCVRAIKTVIENCPKPPTSKPEDLPKYFYEKGVLTIDNKFYTIVIDQKSGGCIKSWYDKALKMELMVGLGNDVVCYEDSGGLWRMGNEFAGGVFKIIDRASENKAKIRYRNESGILEVLIQSTLDGNEIQRSLWFRNSSPMVRMKLSGKANARRTITARFSTIVNPTFMTMDVPGGVVDRPLMKIFSPTYWPAKSFVHLREHPSDIGMAVALFSPACLSAFETGIVEWVAMRNATKEVAFKVLPVLSHPIGGTEYDEQALEYGVWFTEKGDWLNNRVYKHAENVLRDSWLTPGKPDYDALADSVVETNSEYVTVGAVKEAYCGSGKIIRLFNYWPKEHTVYVKFKNKSIKKAWICDSMERDIEKIATLKGRAVVPIDSFIISVRVEIE